VLLCLRLGRGAVEIRRKINGKNPAKKGRSMLRPYGERRI
jgi:hypothetical protein